MLAFFGLVLTSNSDLAMLCRFSDGNQYKCISFQFKLAFVSEQDAPLRPFSGRTNACVEQQNVPMVRSRPTGYLGQSVSFSNAAEYNLYSWLIDLVFHTYLQKEVGFWGGFGI